MRSSGKTSRAGKVPTSATRSPSPPVAASCRLTNSGVNTMLARYQSTARFTGPPPSSRAPFEISAPVSVSAPRTALPTLRIGLFSNEAPLRGGSSSSLAWSSSSPASESESVSSPSSLSSSIRVLPLLADGKHSALSNFRSAFRSRICVSSPRFLGGRSSEASSPSEAATMSSASTGLRAIARNAGCSTRSSAVPTRSAAPVLERDTGSSHCFIKYMNARTAAPFCRRLGRNKYSVGSIGRRAVAVNAFALAFASLPKKVSAGATKK
mmetsp:Transcript_25722/g.64820  ORF Transcript_25722/g.64820 Transcript_25722/m.64820 type:complete len:267 (-) Transcript_25722:1568-2368(-)